MKNFETILTESGIELTEDQKTTITKVMAENYKPIADWQKQVDKVTSLTDQLNTTKEAMKKFDNVDPEALKNEIVALNQKLSDKDSEYQAQIADRDFQDMLKESIATAKGKNAKAITALLDVETLKASKNQKEDIAAALKGLAEAEDSKMLFGEADAEVIGKGNPIGTVTKGQNSGTPTAEMRAIMGLPSLSDKQVERFRGNPYRHGGFITREEFSQYVDRGKEGFERINHRLKSLEEMETKLHQFLTSIERMASNIDHMIKNQEKQQRKLEGYGVKIAQLENKNGKKWEEITGHLWKANVVAVALFMLVKMGIT